MDKPITVAREEFKENFVNLINDAKLPAFVLIGIINDIMPLLHEQEQRQYLEDLAKYKEE